MAFLLGTGMTSAFMLQLQQNCINKWKSSARKNRGLFLLMDQWVSIKQDGKRLENYFIKNNFRKIAIYGMGNVGKRIVKELKDSEIEILYGIDRSAESIYSEIKLVTINQTLEKVDAVVITLVDDFEDVYDKLSEKLKCSIIAIEDIINEI